jgi:hypothetical protein
VVLETLPRAHMSPRAPSLTFGNRSIQQFGMSTVRMIQSYDGKPVERWGRKVTGLPSQGSTTAGLPNSCNLSASRSHAS